MSTTPISGKQPTAVRLEQARKALASGPKDVKQLASMMGLTIRNARTYARRVANSVTLRKPEKGGRWTPIYSLEPGEIQKDGPQ